MSYGYIYLFTMEKTGKIYVGKHKYDKDCLDESYWESGIAWTRALKKYGEQSVRREVLEWCKTTDELNNREMYWINKLNATNKDIGYNISDGGDGGALFSGHSHTQKTKDSIRIKNTGKHNPSKRHKRSNKQRDNIRKGCLNAYKNGREPWNKGKHGVQKVWSVGKTIESDGINVPNARKVRCIETGDEFVSIAAACRWRGVGCVGNCIKGYLRTAGGYHWEYVN